MQPKPTFADGYADAMQGLPPQSLADAYMLGYNNLEEEVDSGFADLEVMLTTNNQGAIDV